MKFLIDIFDFRIMFSLIILAMYLMVIGIIVV